MISRVDYIDPPIKTKKIFNETLPNNFDNQSFQTNKNYERNTIKNT